MREPEAGWPQKTRELHNHHFDSTVWNDFAFRQGDIVIATYAKSGTTWLQQIVGQLVFAGATDVPVAELSPWVDLRLPPKEVKLPALEAQTTQSSSGLATMSGGRMRAPGGRLRTCLPARFLVTSWAISTRKP